MKNPLSVRKIRRNGAIFVRGRLFLREILVTHYKIAIFAILLTVGLPIFRMVTDK
ncbi:hypothetical protein [Bacteroides acidifaciens]|uniref:hypothetical protein n=1 Tax=Bacteroides acidifaciens TaxID=85831 RepID=UPI002490E7E3|nr:hypothetical protein [Bacteroides acidifaciens]